MAIKQVEADGVDTLSSLAVTTAGDDLTKAAMVEFDNTKTKSEIENALTKCVAAVREYLSTVTTVDL